MRILVVTHGFPPAAEAGAEIYARAHARALSRQGHEVVVLSREADPGRPELAVRSTRDNGIRIEWINNTFRGVRCFEDTYRNDAIGRIAERLIDDVRPDAAHLHHLTGLSTSIVHSLAARRIPRVMTLHDYWLICHRGQLLDPDGETCAGPEASEPPACRACVGLAGAASPAGFAAASALRAADRSWPWAGARLRAAAAPAGRAIADDERALRAAAARVEHMQGVCRAMTHFLAPSRFMRDRFLQFGVPPGRITHAPYGFARTHVSPVGQPAGQRQLRIGFVGSLMWSKAPDVLLEAFARLPRGAAVVDLVGPTAAYHGDRRHMDALARLLSLEGVRAHGAVPHERVPARLAAMDVLVVPSIWPENSPLVIQEAFMAGVPVIASRIGGIPELVLDGVNGLLVEPRSVDALAAALTRCLAEPDLLPRLRAGVPAVRDIADDTATATAVYEAARAAEPAQAVIAAVVLNYRTPDDAFLAANSIAASDAPPSRVFVVNNDAREDARLAACLARLGPRAERLEAGRNLGFPGGMNVGIRKALAQGASLVLVANSDVIVPPDCLAWLREALERTPAAGIAGPAVFSRSQPDRLESLGLSFAPSSGRMRVLGAGARASAVDLTATRAVDAVSGCLMLIRREVFDAIGLFDDAYFFGFEDLDFCLRARRAGFATVLAARASVYHEGGRSIGSTSPRRLYFAARNHLRLGARAGGVPGGTSGALRSASIVALNLAHAARPGAGHVAARLAAVVRGVRDHRRGRYGPDAISAT